MISVHLILDTLMAIVTIGVIAEYALQTIALRKNRDLKRDCVFLKDEIKWLSCELTHYKTLYETKSKKQAYRGKQ